MDSGINTVLITGGASGIGRAISDSILALGWNVIIVDINPDNLKKCQDELQTENERVVYERIDVTNESEVNEFLNHVEKTWHPITGVVNSAGIGRDLPALETDLELFRNIIEVNLIGSFLVSQKVAKYFIQRGKGSIVNVASVSGIVGNSGRVAYGASKGGVINMTKVLAVEWAKHGVRVNAIAPGPIDTPLVEKMHTATARKKWTDLVPQNRYGSPKELAGAAVFLLDDTKSSFITGQTITIDGGFTSSRLME